MTSNGNNQYNRNTPYIYKNHTNASYKKLTEIEKKQINLLSMIHRMKQKAKILADFRIITNEIMCSYAYHESNMEKQINKMQKVNAPIEEIKMFKRACVFRYKLANSLFNNLKELLDYAEIDYNQKK